MFINEWDDLGEMCRDFNISDEELKGVRILLASYDYEDYDGTAFVLFKKNRKLFEVNASHCSCYGLEDQWRAEETTIEALRHRLEEGYLGRSGGCNVFAEELTQVLDQLKR